MNTHTSMSETIVAPRFSVIIPCWNAAKTLHDTLDSLRAQSFTNWEALVVDDGSTDETLSIINDYCSRDGRFRALSTNRKGPSAARNLAGLSVARGRYLAFLDSDDLWKTEKLAHTQLFLDAKPNVDAVYAQIAFFRLSHLKPETFSTVYDRPLKPIDFLRDNPVCTMSNLIIKAEVFQRHTGFDETIVHNEDVEFLVRATANGACIDGMNENLVSYRTSLTGLSADLGKMRAGWYKAVDTLQNTPARLSPQEIAAADAGNLRYLARRALRTGAPGFEALHMAMQGLARSPRSFFSPLWRGGMTLLGAVVAPFLPQSIRKLAFSR